MDKFVKLKKIGEGSFGKAFLVKSKKDGGQYVVKEIGILKMNAKEREESRKEVAVLAQLNHPNIVAYRESFEEHGSLYIVMDYCAGGDLYSKISSQRGILFNENQVLDWLVQICLALKHIHDRKILHRDIKSQNIFLTTSGKVRLGDFGIAKVLNSTVELARTCIGTPYYLSPEICENKPYNNKSDVWSLGCVLYELATLKHPFESGNMKNLVLKIIRGSYPPVHCKYSYEMRNLIAQLFKRSPRDRPSINSILKKPFLRPRIQKFLSDAEYSEEFSHTVMHGMKIEKRLVPAPGRGGRPPAVARPPSAGKLRPMASPRYDPAQVYGRPIVRKSRENKDIKDMKKRPGSAENRRPLPPGPPVSLEKRRQDLIAKEKKRQEEARRMQYEKRHQELLDKQKIARMNRDREQGWNNLLGSGDSDKPKDVNKEKPRVAEIPKPKLNWPAPQNNSNDDVRGKYDHYNAYLDQLQRDRENREDGLEKLDYMNADPSPAPSPMMGIEPSRAQEDYKRMMYNPAQQAVRQAEENRVKAGEAAERAKIVEDFINRKKQAVLNKARGNADIMGRPNPVPAQRQQNKPRPSATPFDARNKDEQEYLQNLRKIRLQNFNERHKLKNRVDHSASHEERKKKISALREQADQRAHHLKVNLEREAFERKMKLMENQRQNVAPSPRDPMKYAKPAAAAPMTKILQQIGVAQVETNTEQSAPLQFAQPPSMTKILQQIGAVPENHVPDIPEEQENTEQSLKGKQAEAIRKNLQENPPEAARNAWGAPSATPILQQPDSARSQWGDEHQTLSALPLEQTTTQKSDDGSADCVVTNVDEPMSARKQWGGQAGTVLNALKDVKISSATVTLPKDDTRGDRPEINVTQGAGRLFDKVHLFEEDGQMLERGTKKVTPIGKTVTLQSQGGQIQEKLKKSGLLAGLSTGSFDAPNSQILRTCSEPDLAKLFKTIVEENSFSKHAKPSRSLELGADEMEEEGEIISIEDVIKSENQEAADEEIVCVDMENVEEQEEETEQDEDEDFRTVRESMASLLTLANDDDEENDDGVKVAFSLTDDSDRLNSSDKASNDNTDNGSTTKEELTEEKSSSNNVEKIADKKEDAIVKDNTDGRIAINKVDEQKSAADESNPANVENEADECSTDDVEDDETDEIEYDENLDQDCNLEDEENQQVYPSQDVSSEAEYVDAIDHPRGLPTSFSQLFQSDDSEEEEEDEDEYDVFSNLEESRMELERDLGCDKFLKAYKAVQAVHEDEDEDIEAGTKIALNILGSNQEYLYPKIFQLVMADTAFTEDNS